MSTAHAHSTKEPKFASSLIDRQQQRVDHSNDGDDQRECEQDVDNLQELVDLIGLSFFVLLQVLKFGAGDGVSYRFESRECRIDSSGRGVIKFDVDGQKRLLRRRHQRIELIGGDDPTRPLDREFGLVDRTKGESGCPTLDEDQLNGITDLELLLLGEFFGSRDLTNSE